MSFKYIYSICQQIPQMNLKLIASNIIGFRWIPAGLQTAGCVGYQSILLFKSHVSHVSLFIFIIVLFLVLLFHHP